MTILHISAVKNWGGGENHIENLSYELSISNPKVKNIILCTRGGAFHKRLEDSNHHFETAPLLFNLDPRYIFKILTLCKNENVDLIHLHDPRALALAIAADRLGNLPFFIFSKKISFPIKKRKQTLYKYNYHKIKRYLCVSEQTKNVIIDDIVDRNKLVTIYHGTRIDNKSDKTPFQLREKFHIPIHKKIIGNIANHHKAKNLETLIDVADYLINKKNKKDIHFVQIGTFTERTPALIKKVEELNLQEHISFLGYTPTASNFLPQLDISLITSTNEGIPQVIYESFYHNIPVVSTSVAGIPEIIHNGENGLLAEKKDYTKLGDHILLLMENPLTIQKFITSSKSKLLEKFTTSIMAQRTLNEYKNILQE